MKLALAAFALLMLAACNPNVSPAAADHHIGDTITQQETAINAAAAAKDAATVAGFYAPDAQMFNPGFAPATTPAAILATYQGLFTDPNGSMVLQPGEVIIPSSGDYATAQGTFTVSYTNPATHQRQTDTGAYITLWRHQDDGSWKIMRDIATNGAPPADAAAAGKPPGK